MGVGACAALYLAFLLTFFIGAPVQAATIIVANSADNNTGCTLRQAIQSINDNAFVVDCNVASGNGFGTIGTSNLILLPEGDYQIALADAAEDLNASGDLDINIGGTGVLTIAGEGQGLSRVTGDELERVFHIVDSGTVSFEGMTISKGVDSTAGGGGIYIEAGSLSLTDCLVTLNETTGTAGGGILGNMDTVNIDINNSKINVNKCIGCPGGGIFAIGITAVNIDINSSEINDNEVSGFALGAGIGGGGASTVNIDINNSELNDNTGGAIYGAADDVNIEIDGSFINGNISGGVGGGVHASAGDLNIEIDDSFINGNTSDSVGGGIYASADTANININNSEINDNESADDGGGIHGRVSDDLNIRIDGSFINGNMSDSEGGGVYVAEVEAATVNVEIDASLFEGNRANESGGGIYALATPLDIDISDTRIHDNEAGEGAGGGVFAAGGLVSISIDDGSELHDNKAGLEGGGLMGTGGVVTLDIMDTEIHDNQAGTAGGGVFTPGGLIDAVFRNVEFLRNEQTDAGSDSFGGAYATDSGTVSLLVEDCLFAENISTGPGGAIYLLAGLFDVVMGRTGLLDNIAAYGGGFAVDGTGEFGLAPMTSFLLKDLTVAGNQASRSGGGMALMGVHDMTLLRASIFDNEAAFDGGGLILGTFTDTPTPVNLEIFNSTIAGNTAGGVGAGIANGMGTDTFENNEGDIFPVNSADLTIINSTIAGNIATGNGGGINQLQVDGETPTVELGNTIIADNVASGLGPDCFDPDDGADIASLGNNIISDDSACDGGFPGDDDLTTDPLLLALNTSSESPGRQFMRLQAKGSASDGVNSPAIDTGNRDFCAFILELREDQIENERFDVTGVAFDGETFQCDIGAMEYVPGCGNEVVEDTEECDDGNFDEEDGCNTDCVIVEDLSDEEEGGEETTGGGGSGGDSGDSGSGGAGFWRCNLMLMDSDATGSHAPIVFLFLLSLATLAARRVLPALRSFSVGGSARRIV